MMEQLHAHFSQKTGLLALSKLAALMGCRIPLTSSHELHDQPQFLLHNKGGEEVDDVGMVTVAHYTNLFLRGRDEGREGRREG